MRGPLMPEPFSGPNLSSPTLGGSPNPPAAFFKGGHGPPSKTEELHWDALELFFEENELAIAKAERSTMHPDRSPDYGTTASVLTDTANAVLHGLAALSQVYPALGVAIFAFHAVVSLDLTRRDNDKKVVAVKLQMQSMMCAMFQFRKLRYTHVPEECRDLENSRLQRLIARITQEIKKCGSDLDFYTGRSTVARVITSKVYERRFAEHIETFAQRRSELQNAVAAYTAVGVDTANIGIAAIGGDMIVVNNKLEAIMEMLQNLTSPREQGLLKFIEKRGGPEKCISQDRHLSRLLAMAGESNLKTPTADCDSKESKEQQQLSSIRKELRNDLKNLDMLINQNLSRFERLVEIHSENMRIHMEDTNSKLDQIVANTMSIMDQGRAIEKAIGQTATLADPVLQAVWQGMGIKSTVKAKYFILHFRDQIYTGPPPLATPFGSPPRAVNIDLPPTNGVIEERPSEKLYKAGPAVNQIFKDELKDEWALKYLTVSYIHPIIEAMDEDCSGWITVNEANRFAKARPAGHSLISWMAYWAIGWHYNLEQYTENIYSTILQMHELSKTALRHNRQLIQSYLNSFTHECVEAILRSINPLSMDVDVENDAALHQHAISIARAQEEKYTQNLNGISYVIQSMNDVKFVVNRNNNRVETWILPVLHLLLKRHLDIIVLAQTELLHPDEMSAHEASIGFIFDAFTERVGRIEAIFDQVYRGNVEAHFKVFAYGMFDVFYKEEVSFRSDSILFQEELARSCETQQDVKRKLHMDRPDISILAKGPGKLFEFECEDQLDQKGRHKKEESVDKVDNGAEDEDTTKHSEQDDKLAFVSEDADIQSDNPLDGVWSVQFSEETVFSMRLDLVEDGKITGYTSLIPNSITGDYKTEKGSPGGCLDFDLVPVPRDDVNGDERMFFSGVYDPDREVIVGTWILQAFSPDEELTHEAFIARRTPLELYHLRDILEGKAESSSDATESSDGAESSDGSESSDAAECVDSAELARRRWRFAIECIKSQTTARMNSKKLTIARMDASRDLIEYHYESLVRRIVRDIAPSYYFEKISLGLPDSPTMLKVYQSVAKYRYDRMRDDCGSRFISCNQCSECITHVRYQCITCTKEHFDNQIDLCHRCLDGGGGDDDVNTTLDGEETVFVHKTSHSLLRSTPTAWIKKHELCWLIHNARVVSEQVKAQFRQLITSDGTLKTSDASGGWGNRSIQAPRCANCKESILALPAWACMMCDDEEAVLLCADCIENKKETHDHGEHVLLRISDDVRVWSSESSSARPEEDIEELRSKINDVADELNALKVGMGEIITMMKQLVLDRTT